MSFNRHLFQAVLRAHTLANGLTGREAARRSGISVSTISRLLGGEAPDIDTFATLCNWLQIDANQFLEVKPVTSVTREDEAWAKVYECFEILRIPQDVTEATVHLLRILRRK